MTTEQSQIGRGCWVGGVRKEDMRKANEEEEVKMMIMRRMEPKQLEITLLYTSSTGTLADEVFAQHSLHLHHRHPKKRIGQPQPSVRDRLGWTEPRSHTKSTRVQLLWDPTQQPQPMRREMKREAP